MLIKHFKKFRINFILGSPRILNVHCDRLAKYNVMKVLKWYTVNYNYEPIEKLENVNNWVNLVWYFVGVGWMW
jgi:hypothetical protein